MRSHCRRKILRFELIYVWLARDNRILLHDLLGFTNRQPIPFDPVGVINRFDLHFFIIVALKLFAEQARVPVMLDVLVQPLKTRVKRFVIDEWHAVGCLEHKC